jgi:3-hydroxyacyl-CoA dehydrogenase
VDKLTGPVIGRPKSVTLEQLTLLIRYLRIAKNGIYENCPNDEQHDLFKLPDL